MQHSERRCWKKELWTWTINCIHILWNVSSVLSTLSVLWWTPHRLRCNFCITDFLLCDKLIDIKWPVLIWMHYDWIKGVFSLKLKQIIRLWAQAVALVFLPIDYNKSLTWRETKMNTKVEGTGKGGYIVSSM